MGNKYTAGGMKGTDESDRERGMIEQTNAWNGKRMREKGEERLQPVNTR
jgi:hypothetical protein